MSHSEEKRQQVAWLYASMSDSELETLANEAWTLTELGEEVLRAELTRRGLEFELASAPPEAPINNFVALCRFRDLPEALLAKGFLESGGVDSFLIDETTVRMDWMWSNLLGGVKLCVNQQDAESAAQILNQEIPEKFSLEGSEDFEQPRCPQCQSVNISYQDLDKSAAYGSVILLGVPIRLSCKRWTCQTCGYIWQPTDDPKEKV